MTRTRSKLSSPGPYLAEVTNHLDETFMGGLEVILRTRTPADINSQANTYPVKYMSPFYGVTSSRFQGNNSEKFGDSQKSYGMWMVPPDVGTVVMVIFVDSDPNQGYWIGCVPDLFQNHMVPGIAASPILTPAQQQAYPGAKSLPVAEFNKKVNGASNRNVDAYFKPTHPFADVLKRQGLLLDDIRGITSSSARREQPSQVFGISTPGPLDQEGPTNRIGYGETGIQVPVSRLGGSTFVMDDGDIDGNNELIRLRTRTGHQILMHNTRDLIYIANSRGTAWLEFTSDGKIDIYAADSVSIHTEGDFNLKADRDFNLDAGRNFNIIAKEAVNINAGNDLNLMSTDIKVSAIGDYSLSIDGNSNIIVGKSNNQLTGGRFSAISNESIAFKALSTISLNGQKAIQIDSPLTQIYPNAATVKSIEPSVTVPKGINVFSVPTASSNDGSAQSNSVAAMQRVPMHEPWDQHEDVSPGTFSKGNTDASSNTTTSSGKSKSGNTVTASTALFKSKPGVDNGIVRGVATPWTTDRPFLNKVKEVAAAVGIPAIDLIAGMNLETIRTFDPAIRNPTSTATGLIQFLQKTITDLSKGDVDIAKLSYMSRVEQMDWVEKYFKSNNWPNAAVPNPSLVNVYLTILLPAARFAKSDDQIASKTFRSAEYYANKNSFDPGNLGYFTPGMVAAAVANYKIDAIKTLANSGIGPDLEPLP